MTTTGHLNLGASSATASEPGRRRLFTRGAVGLLAALLLALGQISMGGVATASAHDDCTYVGNGQGAGGTNWTCPYTQLDNGNWPAQSGAPQCGGTCQAWNTPGGNPGYVPADFTGISNVNGVNFYNDLLNAMYGWSGQDYNSPILYQCDPNSSCQYSEVHDGWKDESWNGASTSCGITYNWQVDSANHIQQSTIMYNNNSQVRWWDGPPASGTGYGCDAKATAYHEEGHVWGLGHSSDNADVMFWGGSKANTVTANAQTALAAMYGPYHSGNGGGGSCPNCQTICGASENPCNPGLGAPNLQGYLTKAWDMSQGVSVPNPASYVAPVPACLTYWYAEDFANWSLCAADYVAHKIPNPIP
jgi:hypothetical protein